jgi:hypothetical protein
MIAFNDHHDTGTKKLLNGMMLPAGNTARADLTAAINNIFNHPNVGPFIGKQLIQHLVTSNPSPDYVGRVTAVFNDNGKGVRGDLKAVVKAILLDPEARRGDDPAQAVASDGHLKEPLVFMMNLLRAVNTSAVDACLDDYAQVMKQPPFFSPSVFNFFHPTHQIDGTNLLGPEFEILDTGTAVERINFVNTLAYRGLCGTNKVDLAQFQPFAATPGKLVDAIGSVLMHGQMSADMHSTLVGTVSGISDPESRVKAAFYLIGSSSQFQVQH